MPDAIPLIFDKIKKQNFHAASHILALLGISAAYPLAAWPRIPISIAINSHFLFLHEALFAFRTLSSKTAESLTRLVYFWVTTYLPIWSLVFHRSSLFLMWNISQQFSTVDLPQPKLPGFLLLLAIWEKFTVRRAISPLGRIFFHFRANKIYEARW